MLILPTTIFRSLAGGAIFVVLVSVAASMTLLPALLALLGDQTQCRAVPAGSARTFVHGRPGGVLGPGVARRHAPPRRGPRRSVGSAHRLACPYFFQDRIRTVRRRGINAGPRGDRHAARRHADEAAFDRARRVRLRPSGIDDAGAARDPGRGRRPRPRCRRPIAELGDRDRGRSRRSGARRPAGESRTATVAWWRSRSPEAAVGHAERGGHGAIAEAPRGVRARRRSQAYRTRRCSSAVRPRSSRTSSTSPTSTYPIILALRARLVVRAADGGVPVARRARQGDRHEPAVGGRGLRPAIVLVFQKGVGPAIGESIAQRVRTSSRSRRSRRGSRCSCSRSCSGCRWTTTCSC